ncbi:MAG: hypothetical protein QOF89_2655 [Acidobacteriota bacterium]|jgi:flavin-dependent dehydrogenase|nr:hypothetical protein [Acidobacteriota bacterium]
MAPAPKVEKKGAEFILGSGGEPSLFPFSLGLVPGETTSFNLERAPFDARLLDVARQAGAEVSEGVAVSRLLRLEDGRVEMATDEGEIAARFLVDASGQATLLGKHLGLRRVLPHLKKVACFGHFENVWRRPGDDVAEEILAGKLSAEEVLNRYCTLIYAETGSDQESARRLGLDRRTVKARVDGELLAKLSRT